MSAPALDALAGAKAVGVKIILNGDALMLEARPKLPPDVVAQLKAVKPELLQVLTARRAARDALDAAAPPDCSDDRWANALQGLQGFLRGGWGDQAALLKVDAKEFLPRPAAVASSGSCRAELLLGEANVVAVTEDSITVLTLSGSRLKFRRAGREHIA